MCSCTSVAIHSYFVTRSVFVQSCRFSSLCRGFARNHHSTHALGVYDLAKKMDLRSCSGATSADGSKVMTEQLACFCH